MRINRRLSALIFGVSLLVAAGQSSAGILSKILTVGDYGRLNQRKVPVIGPDACAPTSVVNSLKYLEKTYSQFENKLIPDQTADKDGDGDVDEDDHMIAAAEDLGKNYMSTTSPGGTGDTNMINGKKNYLQKKAPGAILTSTHSGSSSATATWIYQQLARSADVEAGITWPAPPGHWITVYGIEWNTQTNTGSLYFIDPDPGNTNDSAKLIEGTLDLDGTKLRLTYPGVGGATGHIDLVVSEIPEPATMSLVGLGLLAVLRRRRKLARRSLGEGG